MKSNKLHHDQREGRALSGRVRILIAHSNRAPLSVAASPATRRMRRGRKLGACGCNESERGVYEYGGIHTLTWTDLAQVLAFAAAIMAVA